MHLMNGYHMLPEKVAGISKSVNVAAQPIAISQDLNQNPVSTQETVKSGVSPGAQCPAPRPTQSPEDLFHRNRNTRHITYDDLIWCSVPHLLVLFFQLFCVNAFGYTLSRLQFIKDMLTPDLYITNIVVIGVALVIVYILHELIVRQGIWLTKWHLCCTGLYKSFLTSVMCYNIASTYIFFDSFVVGPLVVALVSGATLLIVFIQECRRTVEEDFETQLSHFGITRPEHNDVRINIGPQLVFPIPEEFSTPGAGIGK